MTKWKSGARGGRPDRGGGGSRGGRGRGYNDRGRGGPGRGRGHSHSGSNSSMQDELDVDFTLQTYANAPSPLKPFPAEPSVSSRGRGNLAFRGRGRGGLIPMQLPTNITFSSRGRGFDIPRRYVQGIGAHKDARRPVPVGTLSNLLSQERPLLKPIVFVPSRETRFLFQDEEELMQPIVEDIDNAVQSPIPTADRVTRVFSGGNIPPNIWDNDEDGTEDEIEVVDFNDVGKLFHPTASTSNAAIPKRRSKLESTAVHEEQNTWNRIQETRRLPVEIDNITERVDKTLSVPNGIDNHLFYVDSQPINPTFQQSSSVVLSDDDDVIVYVAPHPRNTLKTSVRQTEDVIEISTSNGHGVDIPGFLSYERHGALPTSISHTHLESTQVEEPLISASPTTFATSHISPPSSSITGNATFRPDRVETPSGATATGTPTRLRIPPITTPRQAKLWKSKFSRASKGTKALRNAPFSAFGTMREEGLLRRLDGEQDKKYDHRRRGDSDLEWGDTTDDNGDGVVGVGKEAGDMSPQEQGPELDADMKRVLGMLEKGNAKVGENFKRVNHDIGNDHGMEIDVDVDIQTLERFANGLTGADAEKYFTTDDIECEEIIKMEDEGDEDAKQRGSSGSENDEDEGTDEEEEEALRIEEAKFMPDGDLGNLDGSDQEMDDLGDDDDDAEEDDDDDDSDEDDSDSSFEAKLNRLRSTGAVLGGVKDSDDLSLRAMTLADQDEAFIRDLDVMLNEKKYTKGRKQQKKLSDDDFEHLDWSSSPAGWRTDLPPELSIQYELDRQKKTKWKEQRERNRLARAADPLSKKKGGKKGRKAMLAAAAVDPTIMVLPNRVIDMTTLVQNIRRFIADVGGPSSLSLPPTDKETRKNVHEIAIAFNLKSVSKGKGDARYTTLAKTTRSGIQVNEGKIAWIVRRSAARGGSFMLEDKKGKSVSRVPKHREGDVVGKAAPKLDESNVGFKLLEQMGWSEGKRIGASTNGLVAPLAAVIKTSKLGLGARK